MVCKKCKKEISEDFKVCPYCGATVETEVHESVQSEQVVTQSDKENEIAKSKSEDVSIDNIESLRNSVEKTIDDAKTIAVSSGRKSIEKGKNLFESWKQKKYPFIIIGVALLLFLLVGLFYQPDVLDIEASYLGDKSAGVVLDSSNKDIVVTGTDENGEKIKVSGWKIENPKTLAPDETSKVEINYKDLSTTLFVECTTSRTVKIKASYSESLEEGTVISKENILVTATLKNDQEVDVSNDCKIEPETVKLEKDGSYDVSIEYTDPLTEEVFKDVLKIECSTVTVTKISASYSGDTKAGAVLDSNNEGIKVTGTLKNGESKALTGWTVENTVTLKQDETSTVKIKYENLTCELKVECTTVSDSKYKEKCKNISYTELARNPSKYEGQNVKFTGKVVQVMEGTYFNVYRINVTNKGYGYYDDTVYVSYYAYGESERILEDDIVTFYGEYTGLESYKTVLGATVTIPAVTAKYIDR